MTSPNFRPNRQESVLGMRSCHSEEDCEEASATSLEDWAKMPPARLGDLHFEIHHCSGHHQALTGSRESRDPGIFSRSKSLDFLT